MIAKPLSFVRDKDGYPRCPTCGCLVEEQFEADAIQRIKERLCPFATYETDGGSMIPRCGLKGFDKCPRPNICQEWQHGCMRLDAYQIECGKMPGKPCPRNICPIKMRDWQVERNARRLK